MLYKLLQLTGTLVEEAAAFTGQLFVRRAVIRDANLCFDSCLLSFSSVTEDVT